MIAPAPAWMPVFMAADYRSPGRTMHTKPWNRVAEIVERPA